MKFLLLILFPLSLSLILQFDIKQVNSNQSKPLGHGKFGEVISISIQDKPYALKKGNICPQSIMEISVMLFGFSKKAKNLVLPRLVSFEKLSLSLGMDLMVSDGLFVFFNSTKFLKIKGEYRNLMDENVMQGWLNGVAELHKMGILHRDLHLGNMLINDQGKTVVSDFGSAMFIKPIKAESTQNMKNGIKSENDLREITSESNKVVVEIARMTSYCKAFRVPTKINWTNIIDEYLDDYSSTPKTIVWVAEHLKEGNLK